MREVRLRHVAQVNPPTPAFERLPLEAEVTFLPMESIWPDERLDKSQVRTKASVATGYTRFQDGDILVPKITPTFEAARSVLISGLRNGVGAGTTELHVLRPGPDVDARYLAYVVQSHSFLKLGESEMYGVAGQKRVPDDFVRDHPLCLPDLNEQRRIADFLDAQTEKLAAISTSREKQIRVLDEEAFVAISETLFPGTVSNPIGTGLVPWLPKNGPTDPLVRLGHVASIQTGLTVDSARQIVASAVTRPYLRVANVQAGGLDLSTVSEIAVPRATATRTTLRYGDVLMTEGGDLDKLGRGTVWRNEIPNCLHQNHVFAIRPVIGKLNPEYLALLTQSLHGRCYFESTGVKTTNLASTNVGKILAFPVPLPSIETQRKHVEALRRRLERLESWRTALKSQISLLLERRDCLIGAAIAGAILP